MGNSIFPSSGGSGTPGGSNTEVQFNDAGAFGGDSGFTFNKTSNVASLTGGLGIGVTAPEVTNTTVQIKQSGASALTGTGISLLQVSQSNLPDPVAPAIAGVYGIGFTNTNYSAAVADSFVLGKSNIGTALIFNETKVATDPGYIYSIGMAAVLTTTGDASGTTLSADYFDAWLNLNHDTYLTVGHDFTNYLTLATGVHLDFHYSSGIFDTRITGAGTIGEVSVLSAFVPIDAAVVTTASFIYVGKPTLSNGATVGTWTGILGQDLSSLTVGTAKNFIDYASGKFKVNSAGAITSTSTITGTVLQPTTGYKSVDGTSGATAGPFTVITGITVKNGLITAITGS